MDLLSYNWILDWLLNPIAYMSTAQQKWLRKSIFFRMEFKIWLPFFLVFALNGHALDVSYKNKVSIGVNQSLRYQRSLPFSFKIGSELDYKINLRSETLN